MTILYSIILGIVQGIGEFLPISSSAHLILVPYLFNFTVDLTSGSSLAFDVALHFGTLIAVIGVFYKDWINLFKGAYKKIIKKEDNKDARLLLYLVIATIPGALIGKLLEDYVESYFREMILVIALLLGFMGVIIYLGDKWAEKKYKKGKSLDELTLKDTFIIGLSQALAIFPGFSRSGTTILTGRLIGASREAAAKFSFFLSVPIILGAAILKLPELINHFNSSIFIGVITSAIVGFLAIKFLMNYIKNNDFAIFAYYRVIVALIIIIKIILS